MMLQSSRNPNFWHLDTPLTLCFCVILLLEVTIPKQYINNMYTLAMSTSKLEIRRIFQSINSL